MNLLNPQDTPSLILISCLHSMNVKMKLSILANHHFVSNDNLRSVIQTDPCLEKTSICKHSVNKVYSCSSCRHPLAVLKSKFVEQPRELSVLKWPNEINVEMKSPDSTGKDPINTVTYSLSASSVL